MFGPIWGALSAPMGAAVWLVWRTAAALSGLGGFRLDADLRHATAQSGAAGVTVG
ncbi:MAG: hypothetical protein K8I04_13265 [Gammaproteobacteria bacterium]|nr:hypothetical protein [Gammaproteobacteria bacterium]